MPGKAWKDAREAGKKAFAYEKETFDHQVYFMRSQTGKRNRVVVMGLFESQRAHEEYVKKVGADARYSEIVKDVDFADFVVPGSFTTDYYKSIG